jgi:hypothetical protein
MFRLFMRGPGEAQVEPAGPLNWRDMPRLYRVPELAFIIVTGILVFILTGYLGYSNQPKLVNQLFDPPAVLYLWLCFILFLILVRHPAVKGQVMAPAVAFLVSMGFVGVYYIDHQYFQGWLARQISQLLHNILPTLTEGRFLANLVNFGVLLWYAVTVGLGWQRRFRGDPKADGIPSGDASVTSLTAFSTWQDLRKAMRGELFSGDLLAGAAIAGFFAWIFSPPVFGLLRTLASATSSAVPLCATTLPVYDCPPRDPLHPPAYITLTYLDIRIAFVFAGVGGLWLISISAIKAFRSVAMERLIVEIMRSLLSALGRLLTLRFLNLIKALWLPALLFAPVATVLTAQMVWCDLHLLGGAKVQAVNGCTLAQAGTFNPLAVAVAFILLIAVLGAVSLLPRRVGGAALDVLDQLSGVLVFVLVLIITLDFAVTNGFGTVTVLGHPIPLGLSQDDQYVLRAVAWLLIASLALIWGLGLWLERWDVITQTLIFLAFLGWLVVAILWVFAMILAGAAVLFTPHWIQPFQVTDAVWFSLAAFVVTALAFVAARLRPGNGSTPQGSGPGAGAGEESRG